MTAPGWLTQRGGSLQLGSDSVTWFVFFDDRPNYSLRVAPLQGKFGCHVKQTVNGQRLDRGTAFATKEQALAGGLEDLRQTLGW